MKEPVDWCSYFANIEKDPTVITPSITVRQFYQAKQHVQDCDVCFNRAERVLARAPKEEFPKRNEN